MVNEELISLCRTVVAAIQDTDSFEAPQLRRLLLHIVPQLLTEIEILATVAESLSSRGAGSPPDAAPVAPASIAVARPSSRRKGTSKRKGKRR